MSLEELKTNTVFNLYPASMNSPTLTQLEIDEHLAKGIPALSEAVGRRNINANDSISNVDLNLRLWPNNWWRMTGNLKNKWLHSDIKDAAFFYISPIFLEIVYYGGF